MIIISLLGGMFDSFTFIYNDKTFCLIQTGNIIKSMINLVNGSIEEGLYDLMLFLVFILGIFIFHLLNSKVFKKLRIKENLINSLIIGLLLMSCIFLKFDNSSIFNVNNVVNGIMLSLIGANMLTSFKEENHILYTPTMMTNNTRKMVEHFEDGLFDKNKEKIIYCLVYLLIIIAFSLGIAIVALINKYLDEAIADRIILLIMYVIILVSIFLNLKIEKESA